VGPRGSDAAARPYSRCSRGSSIRQNVVAAEQSCVIPRTSCWNLAMVRRSAPAVYDVVASAGTGVFGIVAISSHHCLDPSHPRGRSQDFFICALFRRVPVWPGSEMVRTLDWRLEGRKFDSRQFHCLVTTLGKLFTHMCLYHQAV